MSSQSAQMPRSIVCAANPIKEILTASECLEAIKRAVADRVDFKGFIISDGGDGFLESIRHVLSTETVSVQCAAPLGDLITASFEYESQNHTAYIESAACLGMRITAPPRRNIMMSSSAGLADLVEAALNRGAKTIIIGLGGSATCDGGVGFLWKMACHARRVHNCDIRKATDLAECAAPDIQALRQYLGDCKLIACVDVDSPLLGPNGAAQAFAPQKGASPEQVLQLEAWMTCWSQRIECTVGITLHDLKGAGAAGGIGFAIAALGGEIVPGAQTIAKLTGISSSIKPGTLLITDEGRFDQTSFYGKAPWIMATMARDAGAEALIVCAVADPAATDQARQHGVQVLEYGNQSGGIPLAQSAIFMQRALEDYFFNLYTHEARS